MRLAGRACLKVREILQLRGLRYSGFRLAVGKYQSTPAEIILFRS